MESPEAGMEMLRKNWRKNNHRSLGELSPKELLYMRGFVLKSHSFYASKYEEENSWNMLIIKKQVNKKHLIISKAEPSFWIIMYLIHTLKYHKVFNNVQNCNSI